MGFNQVQALSGSFLTFVRSEDTLGFGNETPSE
jgi:hypothetical protein